jgi:hypothetical protein
VLSTAVEEDVLNQGVERVLEVKRISVLSMVEVNDALNQGVERVLEKNPINVLSMVEVEDVQTVSIGLTPEAQILFTMTIAQPVSSDCFPMILVPELSTSIPRRFGFEMRFRNELKLIPNFVGLSTTSRCIPETVIVRIEGVSIIAN